MQPGPDCCTVCAVAKLVTSNTTLETQALVYDGGLRAITVTSVSGHLVRLGSTVAAVAGDDVACIASFEFLSDAPPLSSKLCGIHRNHIVAAHQVLRGALKRTF